MIQENYYMMQQSIFLVQRITMLFSQARPLHEKSQPDCRLQSLPRVNILNF